MNRGVEGGWSADGRGGESRRGGCRLRPLGVRGDGRKAKGVGEELACDGAGASSSSILRRSSAKDGRDV